VTAPRPNHAGPPREPADLLGIRAERPLERPPVHPSIEKLLVLASREVQVLAALSPVEAAVERARLTGELRSRGALQPRWRYAPVAHGDLRRALDAAERLLEVDAGADALGRVHLERVRELILEAELCAAAGTREVSGLARRRYAPHDATCEQEASALCASWLAEPTPLDPSERIASDDADPRSLLSRMREEVGRRRLPFAVVIQPSLAPLAATGDQVILVAPGRPTTEEDVARTVLHEIEGHALPRVRAREAPLALFRVGTARGIDEQEGLALLVEQRHGCLGARRRRMLAARHRTVEAMLSGATFADAASSLVRDHGLDCADAVLVAERAFRGGDGLAPGLGRERVYLESFVRVRAHLVAHPRDEAVLGAGQVALDAVGALAPYVPRT